jgi:hypothetical protein
MPQPPTSIYISVYYCVNNPVTNHRSSKLQAGTCVCTKRLSKTIYAECDDAWQSRARRYRHTSRRLHVLSVWRRMHEMQWNVKLINFLSEPSHSGHSAGLSASDLRTWYRHMHLTRSARVLQHANLIVSYNGSIICGPGVICWPPQSHSAARMTTTRDMCALLLLCWC